MDRTTATAHSGHDELLIARLFGGDVTEPERDRALDLMSGCSDCAALFADLGVIEEADVEMAIPARPREFTLTPADAARLHPRRRLPVFAGWGGPRRALGSSMAALGLVGFVATSYLTGSGVGTGAFSTTQRDAAAPAAVAAATAAPANPANAYATGAASGAPATMGPVIPNSDNHVTDDSTSPPVQPVASSATGSPGSELAASSPGSKAASSMQAGPAVTSQSVACCGRASSGTGTTGNGDGDGAPPAPSSGGPDAALIRLAGFGGLFLAGLAVLLVPLLRRFRTSRRTTRS